MSRIVLAWELGNGQGHLCRLMPIARRLAEQGHAIYLATKDIVAATRLAGDAPFAMLPCPAPGSEMSIGREPGSYSDILAMHGFGDAGAFHALTKAWRDLYSLTGADLLIADHAPLALVSARIAGLRAIHLGDGFTVPPLLSPLPGFRADAAASQPARLALEQQLLAMINHELALAGKPACRQLAQALQGDVTLLATIPGLDPYYDSRQAKAHFIGKIPYDDADGKAHWESGAMPRVFMYLQQQSSLSHVLPLFAAAPVQSIAVVPGIPDGLAQRYSAHGNLRVYNAFVGIDALLAHCDLLVSHGGQGITLEGVRHGLPMLLLPNHVEQLLTTACIARAGAGLGILPDFVEARLAGVLDRLLTDGTYDENARRFKQAHQHIMQRKPLDDVMACICRHENC